MSLSTCDETFDGRRQGLSQPLRGVGHGVRETSEKEVPAGKIAIGLTKERMEELR